MISHRHRFIPGFKHFLANYASKCGNDDARVMERAPLGSRLRRSIGKKDASALCDALCRGSCLAETSVRVFRAGREDLQHSSCCGSRHRHSSRLSTFEDLAPQHRRQLNARPQVAQGTREQWKSTATRRQHKLCARSLARSARRGISRI